MNFSRQLAGLWKQMIHNLNDPDWASRHVAEAPVVSSFQEMENPLETVHSSLETAMRQMGLLSRPPDSLLPPRKP
jgi:hypothetical protein